MNDPQRFWLVAYDIRDKRRLARVGRFVSRHAWRLQYSLFAAHWNRRELNAIIQTLTELIDPNQDDVRFYPVEDTPWTARIGKQQITPGWLRLVQPSTPIPSHDRNDEEIQMQFIE